MHLLIHAYNKADAYAAELYDNAVRYRLFGHEAARRISQHGFAKRLADVLPTAPPQSHNYPPDLPAC